MAGNPTSDLLQSALDLHRRGAVAEAQARYAEVLRSNPGNADAHYYLALISCQSGRFEDGIERARSSVAADPQHARAHVLLGRALSALGRRDESLESLDRAIAIAPDFAEAHSHRADTLSALGRNAEAITSYDRALALGPESGKDWVNRGLALFAGGRGEEAIASFDRAIALQPNYAEAWLGRGNVLKSLERHDEALAAYDRALAASPELAEAWLGRGNLFAALKQHDKAFAAFDKALALKPDLVDASLSRGDLLIDLRRYQEAIDTFDRISMQNPGLAEAMVGRGNVNFRRGRHADAVADYDRALEIRSDLAAAWVGRGNALKELGEHEDGFVAFDRALALNPALAQAWHGRAVILLELRRCDEALAAFDKAIALKPDFAAAWFGHAQTLVSVGKYEHALSDIERGLSIQPDAAEGWLGRGMVDHHQKRFDDAIANYERALKLEPDLAGAWYAYGVTLLSASRADEALTRLERALAIRPDFPDALSSKIFALDFASAAGFAEQQEARHRWRHVIETRLNQRPSFRHGNSRDPARRIRIGYVSSDFRIHSAAYSFRPILLNHDKFRFEITCYSCSHIRDTATGTFQAVADRWRDASQWSDEALCEKIQADGIDILVDLSGHSEGNRLAVFARKPAPIQISAWGHAAGTGLPTVDYLFADPIVCPQHVRHLFAEKIFDLPCCITMEALPEILRPSSLPFLSKGHITFGVFNRAGKVSDEAVALWARILHLVPGSRILMKHAGFGIEQVRDGLRQKFSSHGIAAARLEFRGETSRRAHLDAFGDVDISLDPFPMNGGISTWESLQMGVPVIAKLGNSLASRVGGAIVSSIGLKDWVSETADGYVAIATKFAAMPEYLADLRQQLPAMISASASGNSATYTRAVEAAYRKIWTDYCGG